MIEAGLIGALVLLVFAAMLGAVVVAIALGELILPGLVVVLRLRSQPLPA